MEAMPTTSCQLCGDKCQEGQWIVRNHTEFPNMVVHSNCAVAVLQAWEFCRAYEIYWCATIDQAKGWG